MVYRHIIKSESKDKKLNEMLDRLDQYFYGVLELIPAGDVMQNNSAEELCKMKTKFDETVKVTNDFTDLIVEEHEKLNIIDTKLDGLESMLKDIQEKLDK
jgi:hypothetical protein